MNPEPETRINPRIKNVWRINDSLWICLLAVFLLALFLVLKSAGVPIPDEIFTMILAGIGLLWLVLMIILVGILPSIRYARWRFSITPEYVEISRGIFWRTRTVIPFIRVQNTDTHQGPVLRIWGLSSVSIATAAGEHVIPGLATDHAHELRNRAAELARLAREDV